MKNTRMSDIPRLWKVLPATEKQRYLDLAIMAKKTTAARRKQARDARAKVQVAIASSSEDPRSDSPSFSEDRYQCNFKFPPYDMYSSTNPLKALVDAALQGF